jgi:hypothetical protein
MEDTPTAGMGHNKPSLEDRIFSFEDATPEAVFEAVAARLGRQHEATIATLSKETKLLVGNLDRMPESLDDEKAKAAYALLAAIGAHEERIEDLRTSVVEAAKATLAKLTALCKPVDANLAKLDKQIRPLLTARLVAKIDAHNAQRTTGETPLSTLTEYGPSGSKATLVDGWSNQVDDLSLLPEEYLAKSADQKKIDEAVGKGIAVAGVVRRRDPSLRISK